MRPLRMTGHQGLLPWREVGIEIAEGLRRLVFNACDLITDVAAGRSQRPQFVDLGFEFRNRLFEIEIRAHVIWHQLNMGRARRRMEQLRARANKASLSSWFSATHEGRLVPLFCSASEMSGLRIRCFG